MFTPWKAVIRFIDGAIGLIVSLQRSARKYIATKPEKCNVVKMPYHGNYTKFMGCLDEFLDLVQPEYAVITSSKEEKEADETKELIEKRGIKLFRTRKGGVLFESDGKDVKAVQMS